VDMTETTQVGQARAAMTVGQVAERFGVTVRTLHHYDEVGLLCPSERSTAGYRLYTDTDVTRLQHVVVYRRLGFALEEIALLLDHPETVEAHLRRQRAAVMSRLDEMRDLVTAIDRALEKEMSGIQLTKEEQRELFGDSFSEDYAQEAEQRWGETDAWKQSQARTSKYTKEDWVRIRDEAQAVTTGLARAMNEGLPATGEQAMDLAEEARQHITRWFYDCSCEMHRGLAQLYVGDPRFARTYEDVAPGLAQYTHDAIVANCDRAAAGTR
jgi:MerR family transcriptional regulator, thiopeptide resistance regulator